MNTEKIDADQYIITDMDVQALVDNPEQFSLEEKQRLLLLIESNTFLQKRYEELCWQKRLLQLWWEGNKIHAFQ